MQHVHMKTDYLSCPHHCINSCYLSKSLQGIVGQYHTNTLRMISNIYLFGGMYICVKKKKKKNDETHRPAIVKHVELLQMLSISSEHLFNHLFIFKSLICLAKSSHK